MANPVSKPILSWTFIAGEDLSNAQFRFVTLESDGMVDQADAAADRPIGILQNKPKNGQAATVMVLGVSKLRMNGTTVIQEGIRVSPHTNGMGTTAASTDYPCATIIDSNVTTAGSPATVFVNCMALNVF